MLIVLTAENDIPNEAEQLNQLFASGLEVLHFRKPNWSAEAHESLLNQIESKYHNRIMLHFHHDLIRKYNFKGIHLTEGKRKELESDERGIQEYLKNFPTFDFQLSTAIVSSSFHEMEELEQCNFEFDYHFLSPVFSSISKEGYEGRGFDVNGIDKLIVGLGGISSENIDQLGELGYAGAAVLGTIWNSNDPVNTFKTLNIR